MDTDKLIRRAADVARHAHQGQMYGDQTYFSAHILPVVKLVEQRSADPLNWVVAYLHDVVEDSEITVAELTAEFGTEVGAAVDALTKRPEDGTYTQYILRLAVDGRARLIKCCDLTLNAENIRQNGRKRKNLLKYELALSYLYHLEAQQKEVSTKQVTLKLQDNVLSVYDKGILREVAWATLNTVWHSSERDASGTITIAAFLAPLSFQAFINTHPAYTLDDLTLSVFGLPAVHLLQFLHLPSKEATL